MKGSIIENESPIGKLSVKTEPYDSPNKTVLKFGK